MDLPLSLSLSFVTKYKRRESETVKQLKSSIDHVYIIIHKKGCDVYMIQFTLGHIQ